jgi:hypothetical protein
VRYSGVGFAGQRVLPAIWAQVGRGFPESRGSDTPRPNVLLHISTIHCTRIAPQRGAMLVACIEHVLEPVQSAIPDGVSRGR